MIGQQKLNRIASDLVANGAGVQCYGEFVLAAQRLLYGSGLSQLSPSEREEIRDFLQRQAAPRKDHGNARTAT
jgi:hypothetical protein